MNLDVGPKDTYQRLHLRVRQQPMPTSFTLQNSNAEILHAGRGFIDSFHWTLQLQVGCPGGCLYCYVPGGWALTPPDVRQRWGFLVRNKRRVLESWSKYLEQGTLADKTVYWSGVSDPYAAPPWLTRGLWELLLKTPQRLRPRRVVVQTRFRPDRDAALMAGYAHTSVSTDQGPAVVVSYSVGTDRDDLLRAWERATPQFNSRLRAIEALRRAGIFVVATTSPFGPWNDLHGALARFLSMGVAYVTVLFFKEDTNYARTPAPFMDYLRQEHPFLLDPA